jgi:hypothetical protein
MAVQLSISKAYEVWLFRDGAWLKHTYSESLSQSESEAEEWHLALLLQVNTITDPSGSTTTGSDPLAIYMDGQRFIPAEDE